MLFIGLLSVLAAKAGARRVCCVVKDSNCAAIARSNIRFLKLDEIIDVLELDLISTFTLPSYCVFDTIMIDWRNNAYVTKSNICEIIHARTYFLRADGAGYIFPHEVYTNMCLLNSSNLINANNNKMKSDENRKNEVNNKVLKCALLLYM